MQNYDSRLVGSSSRSTPLWLFAGFWVCTAIAISVAIRRLAALVHPTASKATPTATLDQLFSGHLALTLAHTIPALAFVSLAPFALFRRIAINGWPKKLLYMLGTLVGATAYAMSSYAVGGWTERSAVLFFNTLFLYSLARSWQYGLRSQVGLSRRWFQRAVAVLLGIATTRPVMGLFFATRHATNLSLQQFFGIAFWIGFSINWIVTESWLSRSHLDFRAQDPSSSSTLR